MALKMSSLSDCASLYQPDVRDRHKVHGVLQLVLELTVGRLVDWMRDKQVCFEAIGQIWMFLATKELTLTANCYKLQE